MSTVKRTKRHDGRTISHELAALAAYDDEPELRREAQRAFREDIAWKAAVTERNVALGLQGHADLDGLRRREPPARPVAGTVPLNLLLRHIRDFYGETELKNDLDSVLSPCATERDRAEVRAFARALATGKSYTGYGMKVTGRTCRSCHKPFTARRSTAAYCSETCRKRAARRPG